MFEYSFYKSLSYSSVEIGKVSAFGICGALIDYALGGDGIIGLAVGANVGIYFSLV